MFSQIGEWHNVPAVAAGNEDVNTDNDDPAS